MKRYFISLLLLSITLFAFTLMEGTAEFLNQLKSKLKAYCKMLPDEKVYLHIDKPLYMPGDDIWFTAYKVDGENKPSKASDVLYVELLNPKGNQVEKKNIFCKNGTAPGDFQLGQGAPGGIYKIAAYTTWMKNFKNQKLFEKEIIVQKAIMPKLLMKLDFIKENYGPGETVEADFNARDLEDKPITDLWFNFVAQLDGQVLIQSSASTDKEGKATISFQLPDSLTTNDGLLNVMLHYNGVKESISRSIPIVLNKIKMDFFPEGGDLLMGEKGRIAFKAINEFGKPADLKGTIVDGSGIEITTFESYHMGMGVFSLKPEVGKKYYAQVNAPKGVSEKFELPEPLAKGYALSIDQKTRNGVDLSIFSPMEQRVFVTGQSQGKLNYSKEIKAKQGWNKVNVATKDFPKGIAQFTLFDERGIERCERLVFLNKHKQLNIKLESDKENYAPRERVKLKIRATDENEIGVPAQLSLAVVDDQVISFADDKQDNILSYFHLSGELKGKIEEPFFYFDPKETKADSALDLVMMTHGWRRFTWKEVRQEDYAISHYPERAGWISGRVINEKTKKPENAIVHLFEVSDKKRATEVETDKNGTFLFINVDPQATVYLTAQSKRAMEKNLQIVLDHPNSSLAINQLGQESKVIPEVISEQVTVEELPRALVDNNLPIMAPNITLQEDVKSLSEIVVVGYGVAKKSDLTGSITSIVARDLIVPQSNIPMVLHGRTAGLSITNESAAPGVIPSVAIRGSSSIHSSNNPIYVINGLVMDNEDFLNIVSPNQIKSITVLKSPETTAIYGHRGRNGVVVIQTKDDTYFRNRWTQNTIKFARAKLEPRKFDRTREFYAPTYEYGQDPEERTDFRETIYWNHSIVTDNNGRAEIDFYNSDATTTFRATVEGIGGDGLIGRTEFTYASKLPVSIDLKIPAYLSFEDTVNIPVMIRNNSEKEIKGWLMVNAEERLVPIESAAMEVVVPAGLTQTVNVPMAVKSIAGNENLAFTFEGGGHVEKIVKPIEVKPKGFPIEVSYSGQSLSQSIGFNINQPMKGSLRAELVVYPNIVGELMSGIESILSQPYGCFEQASSSTYPNIIALQYLKESGQNNPKIEKQALAYIHDGYKKLVAFETSDKGYEWFGHSPPHEGLTAYGVLEFTDMKSVYPKVSDEMIKRTADWLLSRRDGQGGFLRNSKALDRFGRANEAVTNAYIVYSLAEAGNRQIIREYRTAMAKALENEDDYQLALVANAAYKLGYEEEGKQAMEKIRASLKSRGFGNLKADHSITYSQGKSLQIETCALIMQALIKEKKADFPLLRQGAEYLVNSRSYGGFGSTQGTILALKALTEFTGVSKRTKESGTIRVYLNDILVATRTYESNEMGPIKIGGLEAFMKPGKQDFKVLFVDTETALPYTLNAGWTSYTPNSNVDCSVRLKTTLATEQAKVNETVRMSIGLSNITSQNIPMTLAIVGIPSGLSLQPWQLKELQEKQVFDFYEIWGSYLVIYYRAMVANETKTIHLDLKAEVPGIYEAPASSAFLYYTNEYKHWVNGQRVTIE